MKMTQLHKRIERRQRSTMKVLSHILVILSVVAYLHAKPQYKEDLGQYVPDNSGQYVHDDSGSYVHDRSGDYIADGLGLYTYDGSGGFLGDGSGKYKGDENYFRKSDRGFYKPGSFIAKNFASNLQDKFTIKTDDGKHKISSTNLLSSGSTLSKQTIKPAGLNEKQNFGNFASGTSPVAAASKLSSVPYDQGRYSNLGGKWKIIRQDEEIGGDGYHWEFETENGITAEETGKLANKGTDKEVMKAKGFYKYTGPDNVLYLVKYTADENGFVADGNHLPTPPPTPVEILKSLDYLKSLGKL